MVKLSPPSIKGDRLPLPCYNLGGCSRVYFEPQNVLMFEPQNVLMFWRMILPPMARLLVVGGIT